MAELIPVGALSSVTYHLINLIIGSRQASNQVRRSLSLVRTCDRDLQYLITLREEFLDILERKPIDLHRLNSIIEDAHKGLLEVGRIVERCRPEAHQGKIPLFRRGVWALFDLDDFNSQVPVMNCHHQSVLTEIQYLRSLALCPPTSEQGQEIGAEVDLVRERQFDNPGDNLSEAPMEKESVREPSLVPNQANRVDSPLHHCDSEPTTLPLSPNPPSYRDPNFIATSASRHISITDVHASRGSRDRNLRRHGRLPAH